MLLAGGGGVGETVEQIDLDHENTASAASKMEDDNSKTAMPLHPLPVLADLVVQPQTALAQGFLVVLAHVSAWLSEMLTFFLCIVFLKQWLQFDLFGGLPPGLNPGAAEADAPYLLTPNNNTKKAIGAGKHRRFKRKNRSRSPSRSVARSVATTDEPTSDISSICGDLSSCEDDDEVDQPDVDGLDDREQHLCNPSAASSNYHDLEDEEESWHSSGETKEAAVAPNLQLGVLTANDLPLRNDLDQVRGHCIHSDSEEEDSLDSELSWLQEHYPQLR